MTRPFSVVIVVSLILVPWAMLVGDAASGDACVIDSEGYCIFTGTPHENGLQPSTDQIVDRDGNVLFMLDQAVAVNSHGDVLQARGTPAMDGDRLIQSSLDGLTDDEKAFHRVMATMFPIRNALMYDIAETTQSDWNILVEELSIRQIKETTYTGGPTPKDNYYGRQGVFDLAKDPAGKDIHHEVMKFLEESGIYLLCHVTSDEFNQMLKDTHPEGHDPCDDAGITVKMPFTPLPNNNTGDSADCTEMVRTVGDPYIVDASLGDDMFPGTAQCPLLTIQRAADLMSDNEVVEVRSGVYHEEVVVSGKSNITFRAAEGDRVVLDGSQDIENDLNATWQMHQDGIYRADLNVHAWQLFIDYEEMMPARWPNASFADGSVYNKTHHWAHGTIDDGPNYSNGELIDAGVVAGGHGGLIASGIDPVGAIAVLNVGSFRTWSRNITSFNDSTGMIGYDPVPSNEWKTKHHDYFLQGKLELLDAPGEWFFDAQNKTLFLMPLNEENPTTLDVRVKTMAYAFTSNGGDRIIIEGMEFFASTFRFSDCDGCAIIDSHLQYPSTSKRSLGIAGEDPFDRWTSRFDKCSGCLVERSAFVNTDGTALEMTGGQNTVNNSQFYNIDWSASDLKSIMTTIILGNSDNVFTNNTIQTTGASATLNLGNRAHIAFNDISDTGHLQSDGAMVQLMQAQQSLAHVHHNWLHDSAKYGIRMDGPAGGINAGRNASVHHNVAWNVAGGIMVKGDSHNASNNTVFGIDHDKNNIIVLAESGGNLNSSTHNNAADKISGHRTKSVESYPVPGDYVNNFNGYSDTGGSVESQLIDPMNRSFCPKPDSAIAVQGAGAYSSTCTNPWTAGATWELITPTPHIMGCTSENSSNHNPLAVFDDDSCKYPPPQTGTGNNTGNETGDGDGDTDQPQDFSILSAYHGLDQLPVAASLLCGFNVAGDDGMPVVFSTQLQVDSVVPESFLVIRSNGESVVPNCATLNPAMEPLEQRTVLLTGDFGTFGETPLRVEVTGPLLTFDGESLLGVSTEDITPLEDGPRVVLAERFAPDTNGLAGECPDGTAQVVQLTWEGGVSGPAGAALGEDQRLGTRVLLEDGATVNPLALVDDDPDNHVLACLAEDSPAQSVEVHAGLFHDPGDIANPATQAEVTDTSNHTVANSTENVPGSEGGVDESTSANSVAENEENQTASGRREAEQSSGVDSAVYLKFGGAMCATGIILGLGMFLLTRDD